MVIFLEKASSPEEVARKGMDIFSYFPQIKNSPSPRIIAPEHLDKNIPMAFFDGASQNLTCEGGATLFLNPNHHFQISMGLGSGTNNYDERMTLKLLLFLQLKETAKRFKFLVIQWLL